ncbi:hypothetical protein EW146_g3748 [Bondarzewia mesenterica]|uniref:Tcp11-domain-containing protein n=1 Tax=Bondarzewia mesenterica TaxID=1095465 RepID=A0A4S4LWL2_9AGAM|nr:hypothetical protein EW146_g3748 [Bondarzewia mesenterica]
MDDVARESLPKSLPIRSLPRKRKADADDCEVKDPSSSTQESPTSDSQKLIDRCTHLRRLPPSPPRPRPTAPHYQKRPRLETPPSPSKESKRTRRAQDLVTALQALKGSWQWATSSSGDTRLVAPHPHPSNNTSDALSRNGFPSSSPSHIVIPIDPCSPHIPIRQPPINKETLRELDLDSIMRNPQLRHDFLFDSGLQFRAASSRRKRDQAEMYWNAVFLELETGCTCVTFDIHGRPHGCQCVCRKLPTPPADPIIACMPLRQRLTLRMPSRIKPLFHELLEVLLSIIRPQNASVPSVQGGNVSVQQRLQQQHEHTERLHAVLDPELIEQEMKHGLYDPSSTFKVIGEVMKAHCAPMRDQAVDGMVALAYKCAPGGEGTIADAVHAIRHCFEILELMKLDIANHQMQTLRPFIIRSSPEFELRTFKERHERISDPLQLTQQWLTEAHQRLDASQYNLNYPARSFPYRSLGKRTRVILSTLKGLIDLVFTPPSPVPLSSPPVTTTVSPRQPVVSQLPGYPETLYLDHSRLILLTRDAADLTAIYMLLMLYRQLLFSSPPTNSSKVRRDITLDDADLQTLKKEIFQLGPSNIGRCFLPSGTGPKGHQPSQSDKDKELQQWNHGIKSVVLQLTARATEARLLPSEKNAFVLHPPVPCPRRTSSQGRRELGGQAPPA